jgi:uncharacterized protein
MNKPASSALRLAILAALAQAHPGFGRTALMKLAYFLQVLKGVPLGYSFRLYTYGLYDAQVLEDLKVGELTDVVRIAEKRTSFGVGSRIEPGPKAERVIASPHISQRERRSFERHRAGERA